MGARPSVAAPQIDPVVLGDLGEGDPDDLEPNTDLQGVRFRRIGEGRIDLGGGSVIAHCEFSEVTADELSLASSRVEESRFTQLGVPVLKAARSNLRHVTVEAARLGAIEAYEANWKSVHFRGCKIDYLNLRGAETLDLLFTDCVIGELDLVQARTRRVRLAGTRLGNLTVHGSTLVDFDLRDAELARVTGVGELKGAVVSPLQLVWLAPALAAEFGIRVLD